MPQTHDANVFDGMLGRNTSLHHENVLIFRFIAELCACNLLAYSRISRDKQRRRRLAQVSSTWLQHWRKSLPKTSIYIYIYRLSVAANKKVFDSENSVRIAAPSG